ncbi:MAG: TetR/AcrR family transcriptional regulator [Thermomicrobiales bacterium]
MTSAHASSRIEQRAPEVDGDATRPQRADARKNRERLLAVADAIFAAQGVSASTEDVAREAGVGIGTVFRHFPTKAALLEAVVVGRLRRFADEAHALARDDSVDAGEAFFTLFARAADQSAAKNAVAAALADTGVDVSTATRPIMEEMRRSLELLLIRAQRSGAVRADVDVDDVVALLIGAARAAEHTGRDRANLAHAVVIICDGLRPPSR